MKQRWTNKAKAIRNLLFAARMRNDYESASKYQEALDAELKNGEEE